MRPLSRYTLGQKPITPKKGKKRKQKNNAALKNLSYFFYKIFCAIQ